MPDENLSAHDAAMVAKVDAVHGASVVASTPTAVGQVPPGAPAVEQKPAAPVRPDHVPEKFWDAATGTVNTEALLKSYSELEKGKPAAAAVPAEGTPTAPSADDAAKAVADAKLDMGVLQAEFAEKGALSDDSIAALEKAGISKAMVDQYIAGQQAIVDRQLADSFALVGGQEQYAQMVQWAATNLSAADQAAFNASVSGQPAQVKQAILALQAQYVAANGSAPKLINGQSDGGSESETPFASRAEVTAAMRDARYRNDPAYRAMVERRIGMMDTF